MKCQLFWSKLKCVTVEPVLFFYMLVIFLESNAIQELVSVKSCLKVFDPVNISDCKELKKNITVEHEKVYWARYNGAFLFFFTFVSSFFVASWSDKFGRKFPMLIPPIGTIIAASINCVLSSYIYSHVAYLFISSSISGLTFGSVGIIATTFGFITDISDESSRTKRMMIMEAMIYVGGTVGIYIAGEFLKNNYDLKFIGFPELFLFEIIVAVVITIYIIVRIPNHCDNAEHLQITCKNLFKLDHIKDAVKTVFRSRDAGKRKIVLMLSLSLFFIYFGLVVQFTLGYYFLDQVLNWDVHKYSGFNSIQFAVEGITLIVGLLVFSYLLKVPDHLIAILGILSKMAGYIAFGLSNTDALAYSCIAWYMFSEYPVPAIRSILTKTVDADERGRIFAFTTMLQNFCFLVGSFTLMSVYQSTVTIFPGLCFELVASLQAIALCIIVYLYFTRGEVVTVYEVMENDDGSVEENCSSTKTIGSIN